MSSTKDQEIFYLKDKVKRLTKRNAELNREVERLTVLNRRSSDEILGKSYPFD